MENTSKLVTELKAPFDEIDKNYLELTNHQEELTARIEALDDDCTLESVKASSLLKVEVGQIHEVITKLLARRERLSNDLASTQTFMKLQNAVNADAGIIKDELREKIEETWNLCTQLRKNVFEIKKAGSKANAEVQRAVDSLKPFCPVGTVFHTLCAGVSPRLHQDLSANSQIIKSIEKMKRSDSEFSGA